MSRYTIPTVSDASVETGVFYLPLEFALEHGGVLTAGQLAFDLVGPKDAPLVVVLGGISAGRDVTNWWSDLVGPGRAVDTNRYRVLGLDFLGGAGVSTGPGNWDGVGGFPLVTSQDQAKALGLLLQHLRVERVHRFIGSSYGGMVALAYAALTEDSDLPEAPPWAGVDGIVAIAAAHESHPMASAWRSLQRRIVSLGRETGAEKAAVALARGLAMTTYRSHEEFGQRFDSAPTHVNGRAHFPVEEYLDARGCDFADRFSSEEFVTLSQAIDLHRVDPSKLRAPTLLLGFTSDQLVPIRQLQELAVQLGSRGRLVELPSLFGHDGFLKEVDALTSILRNAVDGEVL